MRNIWLGGVEPQLGDDVTPAEYEAYVGGNDGGALFANGQDDGTWWSNVAFVVAVVVLYPLCAVAGLAASVQMFTLVAEQGG